MTPEEREALKAELRREIMAEVHSAIWWAIHAHVNGPSPAVAAPIVPWSPHPGWNPPIYGTLTVETGGGLSTGGNR